MKHVIQCFCILILSAFVASLPPPNEHHVHKPAVRNEGETPQQDPKIHKTPETEHVNENGVYKNQNSYPHHYNHRRPVHQYHHGVHGYNPRWPPAYVGYDARPVHRPLNPVLIPKPHHRDETHHQDSGEDPVSYSGHLDREPREENVPLIYADHHHPSVYPEISEHPYHGHHPLPSYHSQVHEYPPYPVHNRHVPRQSVLPVYLFSAPGGSQIRNYFQRILHKVPQRRNIKKKPKIIIEYLNGTVEYVDIPDLIEYAPGVVLDENGDKIVEGKDVVESIPSREEISVAEPSYVFEPKYVPPSHKGPIVISETHIRENPIKTRQEDGVVEEYIDDTVKPDIEVDSNGTPKVALVVEEIVPEEVIISEDNPVVEPADDSYYYIKQRKYIGHRPEYRYRPIEVRQKNINPKEAIDESYNDQSYSDSRELPTVRDTTQDDYTNYENEPMADPYAVTRKHYVRGRPSRIQYRRILANGRPENDKPDKPTDEPYNEDNNSDPAIDFSVPTRETIVVGDDTPQDVPAARNPNLNPEYEYYIRQRQYVGQKPYSRGQYISRPIRYHGIPPNVLRDEKNPDEARDGPYQKENDSGSGKDYGEPSRETSIVRDSQQESYPNSENEPEGDIRRYVVRRPAPDNRELVTSQDENQQNPTKFEPQDNNPEKFVPNNNDNNPNFDVAPKIPSEYIRSTATDNEQNDYPNGEKPVEGSYHSIKHIRNVQRRPTFNENEPVDIYSNNKLPLDSGESSKETTTVTSVEEDDKKDEPSLKDNAENDSEVGYENPEQKPVEESQVIIPQNKHNHNQDNVEPEIYNSENHTNDSPSGDDSPVSDIDTARPSNSEQKPLEESQVIKSQNKDNQNLDNAEPEKHNSENAANDFPSNDYSSASDTETDIPSNIITKDTLTKLDDHPNSEKSSVDNDTPFDNDQSSKTQIKYYIAPTYVKPKDGDTEKPKDNTYNAGGYKESSTDSNGPSTEYTTQVTTTTDDQPPIENTEKNPDYNKKKTSSDEIPSNVKHEDERTENIETNSNNDNHSDSPIDSRETSAVSSGVGTEQETTTTRTHQKNTENESEYSDYNVKPKQADDKPKSEDISKVKPAQEDTEKPTDDSANETYLQRSNLDTTESTIVTPTIKKDETSTNNKQNDPDSTKQKESKGPKHPHKISIENGPINNDEPSSGGDKKATSVTTTVIHNEQDNGHPYIKNDSEPDSKTKLPDEGQVIKSQEVDNRNRSPDKPENDNTKISKDDVNYNDNYSDPTTSSDEPSTVSVSTSARDNYPEKDSVGDADYNENQQPSDSDTNEYHHIFTNDKPQFDKTQKPTDNSNDNDTKVPTTVIQTVDDTKRDNNQPNVENDEPSDIVKQKHKNINAEKPADNFNNKDDKSNLKPDADNIETTKVGNTEENSTLTKDDQPKSDKTDSIKNDTPQNYENGENTNEKHIATITDTSDPTSQTESSEPQFEESIKQSDVDGSTVNPEVYPEEEPNDFDKVSSQVKVHNEDEPTDDEPLVESGTGDDKGYESTIAKTEKTDNAVDPKEEKTAVTQGPTAYKENNDKSNPRGIHEVYNKDRPTTIETIKEDKDSEPNHYKVNDNESTTTTTTPTTESNNDFDDDRESVEDEDDNRTIPNNSSNESVEYNSDDEPFNDSAEEFDHEPIEKDDEEIDQANEYAVENDGVQNEVEDNDQSPNPTKSTIKDQAENEEQGQKEYRESYQDSNEDENNDEGQINIDENGRDYKGHNSKKLKTIKSTSVDNTDSTTSTSTTNKNARDSSRKGSQATIYNKRNDVTAKEKDDQVDQDDENSTGEIILDSQEIACNIEENKKKSGCRNQETVPLETFHPNTDFYKKLIEEYNRLHFFRMNSSAALIHRDTKSLVYENGTVVDYLSESYWEKENDDKPIKVRTSQVIRQPLKNDEKDC